ncbi:hypothetical protein ACP70R_033595 [Stipagrostis hirtigluma subsp. patula]
MHTHASIIYTPCMRPPPSSIYSEQHTTVSSIEAQQANTRAMASVARQPAAASMPMMARVDRLDHLLAYLEEMHHHQHRSSNTATSSPSTPRSRALSDDSSAASTPRAGSWRRATASSCRPAKEALEEAQAKGSLLDRIALLEDRLLRMEDDIDICTPEKGVAAIGEERHRRSSSGKKKGIKSFVKSCVRGKLKTKD